MGALPLARIWVLAAGLWATWGVGALALGGLSSSANLVGAALLYAGLWLVGVQQWWFWRVRRLPGRWRATTRRQWLHSGWMPLTWMGLWLMGASVGAVPVLGVFALAVALSAMRLIAQGIAPGGLTAARPRR